MPLDNETPKVRNNPQVTPDKETVQRAHEEAEKDIELDGELNITPSPIDDLDEGEFARLTDDEKNKL